MSFARVRAATVLAAAVTAAVFSACAGARPAGPEAPSAGTQLRAAAACTAPSAPVNPAPAATVPPGIKALANFTIETIARVPGARELAVLPNGDLVAGSHSQAVYIVPHAESNGAAGAASVLTTLPDSPAAGVAFAPDRCELYFGTQYGVYAAAYTGGALTVGNPTLVLSVRGCPGGGCGADHHTTSVAYSAGTIYVGVGSDCNACTETDPTRAVILKVRPDGSGLATVATRIRNPIALAVNPATGSLWAGGAGQDGLPYGHPYEYLDDVSAHAGAVADYGWPACEENNHAYTPGADCSNTVAPLLEQPAYSTIVGAAFYPAGLHGPFAFPPRFAGALFATAHGSWHVRPNGSEAATPKIVFFPMHGDVPATPVDWNDPNKQWHFFAAGFEAHGRTREGRPTGIAVGALGSLFVADDYNGLIYRIRYHARQ